MKKISKEKLEELYTSNKIVQALELNEMLETPEIGIAISRVEQFMGKTINELAIDAAKEHENLMSQNDKNQIFMLLNALDELADIVHYVFGAENPGDVVPVIHYYHKEDYNENLDKTIKNIKNKTREMRDKLL